MAWSSNSGEDKIEFREIILSHLQKILKLSVIDLRSGIQSSKGESNELLIYEDRRYSYIQAVENLAYVLIPYYDKDMTKAYDKCIKVMTAFGFEVRKLLNDECDEIAKEMGSVDGYIVELQLRYAKELFVELNLLLKRNDYLKSITVGESRDENVKEEEEGEK